MKKLIFIFGILFSVLVQAQTGIGTTTPNASAKLDVYSTNKGFLPPRVSIDSAKDVTSIASPAEGLLVYNTGTPGLQAGYYYWNGANWATIATATSAGNGVTSMDMVKLYSKGYSKAIPDSTIGNDSGYKFIVPISGRYLFDFTSSGYASGATATMTFKVRQGTADLATDAQTGLNNTVHVEYNGKVEVNLQSGTTYNVYVTTTGIRDGGDYDRVYYKLVAGNIPVTGQSVDYIQASLSANQALTSAGNINFNTSSGTGITITSGGFDLKANKTYKLEAAVGGISGGYAYYGWVDNTNALLSGGSIGAVMKAGAAYSDAPQDKAVVYYTPTLDTRVFLRVYNLSGTLTAYAPSFSTNYSSTWASIQQIGSSAIINPWTLSGTNTYNITGNVGIGNNSPTTTLDVTGTGKFSTSLINSGSRTYLGKDGSNMHWLATTDAVSEANNLAYGFESNGTSIQTHKWYTGGISKMILTNSGKLGIGTSTPGTSLHIENGNTFGTDPSNTTSPSLYILNNNNSSTSAHSSAMIRTGGLNGGKPYLGFDVLSQFGYSIGINNPTDQMIFNTTWNFSTGTAGNNAITINRSGRSRVMIPEQGGSVNTDWPSWGGGLATYDICAASIYASNYVTRSDMRLKNSITNINANEVNKYLELRPVTFFWNQDKPRDPSLQYGLIAQEVEKLFPEMVITASDSMQTKSINYQALHAISLKVIQTQQEEINQLKKKQTDFEARLLKLEGKLN